MQHAAGSLAGLTGLATPGGSGPAAQLTRGHLVLAAANSQPVARRDQSYFVVNAQRSGDTARLFVISRVFASTSRGYQLDRLLTDQTHRFLRDNGMTGGVGGVASQFADYHHAAGSFIPVLIASLSLVSLLLLITILRAVVLPLAAVLLNLAVVGASFGLLKLLFEGSHPVLGGPGFVDVVSLSGIFTILFSLSVDYEVFLLTRMREDYLVRRSPDGAVLYGVGRTASVVTGAALIMTAVFLAFGSSGFITLRQFGVGLAIAVLLDALLLRLVLLPAVMHLLGHWSWWLPRRLKRRLPSLTTQPDPRGPLAVLSDSLAAGPSAVAVAPGDSWRGRLTAEPVRNGGTSK
jgi:RND superfamily putative drug exporter